MTIDIMLGQLPIEQTMGFEQPGGIGGDDPGSGGGSVLEQAIADSMHPWDTIVYQDDTSMMTADGFLYVDRDENGWFDYVEWSEDDDTIWVWKDEDGWKPKQNPDPNG